MIPHPPWIVGHIVGERPPTLLTWVIALVFGLGVIAAVMTKATGRKVFTVIAIMGLAGSVWDIYERGLRPPRPDLRITLVLPRHVTTMPVPVEVCGTTLTGRVISPDGQRAVAARAP